MAFLIVKHNAKIILLSWGIAFIGSYLAICLCEHYRLYSFAKNKSKLLGKYGQLCMMAFSLGGVGIWGMHFVGMASMSLETVDGTNVSISFYILPTLISLIFVLLFAFVGLYISSLDIIFTKSKAEIVELFVKNASQLSMKQIRDISGWKIISILATQSLHHLSVGGIMAGTGVCCMHYLGMWAMSFEGIIVWNKGIIATSAVIALVVSTMAFWILFRLLSLHQHVVVLRFVCAFVMAVAICGIHYVGMAAARFEHNPFHVTNHNLASWGQLSSATAFTSAMVAALMFSFILVILIVADLRAWLQTTSDQLEKAEHLLYLIDDNSYSTAIRSYFEKKRMEEDRLDIHAMHMFKRSSSTVTPDTPTPRTGRLFSHSSSNTSLGSSSKKPLSPTVEEEDTTGNCEVMGYAEQRVKPKTNYEHPSLVRALSEYRVNEALEEGLQMQEDV